MPEVRALTTEHDLAAFVEFGARPYKDDPWYTRKSHHDLLAELHRPTFINTSQAFVAYQDTTPAARAVAMISPSLKDEHGAPYGMIGYYEALNDPPATLALFDSCLSWLRSRGVRTVVGPMNGDTWHSYRLAIGPWERPPFLMEPYNPPYYPCLWEHSGFTVLETYHSKFVPTLSSPLQQYATAHERASQLGVRFRPIDLARWDSELDLLHDLTCGIFHNNFLYTPIGREDFRMLYANARSLIDPSLVWFALSSDGTPTGFAFAFPDRFRGVQAMRGRSNLLARARFLLNRSTHVVNIKTLGVLKGHRSSGTAGALFYLVYKHALQRGLTAANLCLIRDGNPSSGYDGGSGTIVRRYNLYSMSL